MANFCISSAVFMTLMFTAKLFCADIRSTISRAYVHNVRSGSIGGSSHPGQLRCGGL